MVIGRLKRDPAHNRQKTRAFVLLGAVSIWGLILTARLVHLQVYEHEASLARTERNRTMRIRLPALRGDIFARRGEVMARSVEVRSLSAQRDQVGDPARVAELLAPVVEMPVADLRNRLVGSGFAHLRRQMPPEMTARVRELIAEHEWTGIHLTKESKRYYPNRNMAAQVVGAVNIDNAGIFGIESGYDDWIAGEDGWFYAARDGKGAVLGSRGEMMNAPTRGDDIVLTLDWELQFIAEQALQAAVERSGALGGSAVTVDVRTGEILSLANYPTFDLNDNNDPAFLDNQVNSAVALPVEPGSVMKVFTAAAAMHEGLVSEQDIIDCQGGVMRVPGGIIRDWTPGMGRLTLTEVLMRSSNVGAAKVALRMSEQQHYQWLLDFGFTTLTGVGLPGETPGYLANPRIWSGRTQQTIAFGQAISATPLQVATALAAIANGGKLLRPQIIRAVRDRTSETRHDRLLRDGTPIGSTLVRHRVLQPDIARRVALMMEAVVGEDRGTGKPARIDGYRVAGKTSTAQKFDNEARAYVGFVAGFGGFLPVSDPRIAIFVAVDQPRRGFHNGSTTAAPVFKAIGEAAIRILRIAPDSHTKPSTVVAGLTETAAAGTSSLP